MMLVMKKVHVGCDGNVVMVMIVIVMMVMNSIIIACIFGMMPGTVRQ